jgi:hypothetical protein
MSEGETAERALQYLNPLLKIQRIGFAGAQLFEEFECVNHVISAPRIPNPVPACGQRPAHDRPQNITAMQQLPSCLCRTTPS